MEGIYFTMVNPCGALRSCVPFSPRFSARFFSPLPAAFAPLPPMPASPLPDDDLADSDTDDAASGEHGEKVRSGIQSIEVGFRLLDVLTSEPRAMMLRDPRSARA